MPYTRNIGTSDSIDTDILNVDFPHFTCICELCDCGRHKHHHDCKKKRGGAGSGRPCDLSHYQQTYRAYPEAQRQLPLIPPPTPRDPNPPRMVFKTTQRDDFVQRGDSKKPSQIKPTETYQPSKAPLDGQTVYKETYPGHTQFPQIQTALRPPTRYRERSAKFDNRTMHKEQFRAWAAKPSEPFGELPSFASSILYPGAKMGELQSMTQNDYVERPIDRREMIKAGVNGEIKVRDGKFDHNTVNRLTYKDMGPGHKSNTARPSNQYPTMARRAKFDGITQSKRDFAGYQSQPLPQKPCTPPPATIRLSMDSRMEFVTEQTQNFAGHDVLVNPKPAPIKKDSSTYNPPTVKFSTESCNKVDFRPIEDKNAYQQAAFRRPQTQSGAPRSAKFYDQTTNNRFYQDWGAKPRIRYGDFHEEVYVKPQGRMETETWNTSTYQGQLLDEPTPNFKPNDEAVARSGPQDFTTIHKTTYKGQQPKLCKSQLYLLQQEMRRRKKERQQRAAAAAARNSKTGPANAKVQQPGPGLTVQGIRRQPLTGTV